ncbi:MAG: hypothetical protein GY733_22400 [bacterium]|nr:hypothetical protein [bacterium]
MTEKLRISDVAFARAQSSDRGSGLLGWVACTVAGLLRVDGIAVRRTLDGRVALAFPCRKDGRGRKHYVVRPVDDEGRVTIERQVLAQLGLVESSHE